MLSVNTNISSLSVQRSLQSNSQGAAVAMERLASGKRINSAKDDAAGLAISNRLESQIRGVTQGIRNLSDTTSVLQVAEGGMASIDRNLQRMRELAVQAANGSYSDADRSSLNNEATQLLAEIDRVASTTSFGGQSLLDGTFTNKSFNLGNAGEALAVSINSASSSTLDDLKNAYLTLGVTGTVSNSDKGQRVAVSSTVSGDHAIIWEKRNSSPSSIANGGSFQRFNMGVETLTATLGGSQYDGTTPDVQILSNGNAVMVAQSGAGGGDGLDMVVKVLDSLGNELSSVEITDHLDGSPVVKESLSRPFITDLGGGEFLISYSTTHDYLEYKGMARKFDSSGNQVGAEITLQAGTTTGLSVLGNREKQVWLDAPISLGNDLIVIPVSDRSDGTTTLMKARLFNLSTSSVVADILLDNQSASADTASNSSVLNREDNWGLYRVDGKEFYGNTIRLMTTSDGFAAIWRNDDDSKLYGQSFNTSGASLTSKIELISDADYLHAISTNVDGNDYFNLVYGDDVSGVERLKFQSFNSSFAPMLDSAATLFSDKKHQAELVDLGNGTFRAYESDDKEGPITYQDFTVTYLASLDLTQSQAASASLTRLDRMLENLNTNRSAVGAQMSRIGSAISTLQITQENSAAAKSRIVDADYAAETARLAKHQILQQASISVLTQANSRPEMVLALLRDF